MDVNRWSSYQKMVKEKEKDKVIEIECWSDYFKLLNEKLNIKISKKMELDLIKNDIKNDILQNQF